MSFGATWICLSKRTSFQSSGWLTKAKPDLRASEIMVWLERSVSPKMCSAPSAAARHSRFFMSAEHIFGDTLRSNQTMISLARKSGFAFVNHPDDWKLVRFDKEIHVAPKDIPCDSWRLAALSRQAGSPSASA